MKTEVVFYRVGTPLGVALGRCPIAVAGTREPTLHGRRLAQRLGRMLAERGYAVVTGLARGVDEEATLGALKAGGHVVAVLPYLLEEDGGLSPRAKWLLHAAAKYGAMVAVVSENLVEDAECVKTWLAARNKTIARLAVALVVPEARYKRAHWGTRYAVEHAISMGRPAVVLEPRIAVADVVEAFEHFKQLGALTAKDVSEALSIVTHQCSR